MEYLPNFVHFPIKFLKFLVSKSFNSLIKFLSILFFDAYI